MLLKTWNKQMTLKSRNQTNEFKNLEIKQMNCNSGNPVNESHHHTYHTNHISSSILLHPLTLHSVQNKRVRRQGSQLDLIQEFEYRSGRDEA